MIVAIIKNNDNTYEYLYVFNNMITPLHVGKNGFSKSDESYISSVLSMFKYSKDCEYLMKFKEYDVYYDLKTNLKHFLLNGIEDFEMLYKYNGENACLYRKNKEEIFVKRFVIAGIVVILSLNGVIAALIDGVNADFGVYTSHKPTALIDMYNYGPIDYNEAIDYINLSNFPMEVKEVITNEEFLKLIFSYYKGTSLEYSANLKFKNLKIESFSKGDLNNPTTEGFYNPTMPNTLHIMVETNENVIHEFIHLLQAEGSPYLYLNEAVAELMTSELLNRQPSTYFMAVDNLKLLINIVGPEPIYEMSFGGNYDVLTNILRDNLSDKDFVTLNYYLRKSGNTINEDFDYQIEMKNILYKLYKNMYGKDITQDRNIMCQLTDQEVDKGDDIFVDDGRKFLVPTLMNDKESVTIRGADLEKLKQNGILNSKICYKKLIKIEDATSALFYDSSNLDIEWKENYNDEQYMRGKIIYNGDKSCYKHFKNPIKYEDYSFLNIKSLTEETYTIREAIDKGYISAYKVIRSDAKINDDYEAFKQYLPMDENTIIGENGCTYMLDGLKVRFKEQYDNIMSRINNESYHK